MCRALIRAGWTLNDIEEADFETLVMVVCGKEKEKKMDLVEYMKQERGVM